MGECNILDDMDRVTDFFFDEKHDKKPETLDEAIRQIDKLKAILHGIFLHEVIKTHKK
jgi:hypothetical protein